MLNTPILKAKLTLPEIPQGVLFCDRIRMLDIAGPRALIITAPAGYGKTTAVLLSLQHARERTSWYRLEKEDAELHVFFAHLIESLFGSADRDTDSARSLSSIGNIVEEYSLLSAVVCQDAWSLYADSDEPRYLVFDDFQNVSDNPSIRETVRYLISNMPPKMRLIVISRTDPGVFAEKLTLSGELVFLDSSNLLFSKQEIELLFSEIDELETRARHADEAFNYTEGWIAGVTLMKHVMERRGANDRIVFHDDMQNVFRYLLGEVLVGADREMVGKAARISLLDEFIAEDLAAIFSIGDPEETIVWLEQNCFYIQKVNTDPPSYRFHSLFRDALRHVLAGDYSKDEITGFHMAAAAHYEKTGRYKAAIFHYLSGSDEASAVRVAAVRGIICMDDGDIESAADLMRALPENLIFGDAALLCILGGSLSGSETERGFAYLEKAIDMAVKNKRLDLAIKFQGFAISVCVQQNNFGAIEGIIKKVPMPKAMMVSKQARKMLLHSLFLKSSTSSQVRLAKILSRIVDRVGMKDQVELWQYSSLLSKAALLGVIGDFGEAEDIIRRLSEHPVAVRNDRWRAFGLQLCGLLSNLMGKTDLLMQCGDALISLGLKYDADYASNFGTHYTALAKYQSRDLAAAITAENSAERLFLKDNNLSMALLGSILSMSWQAEQSTGSDFAAQIEEKITTLAAIGGNTGNLAVAKTLAAALYLREGSLDESQALLEECWKWARSKQALQSLCGISMHLSELHHMKGDFRREKEYLKFFGETSAKNRYVFFREMNFAALVRVCARCVENNIAAQHMAVIIGKYFGSAAVDSLVHKTSAASADPSAFIRSFPAAAKSGVKSVRVKLFGSFGLVTDGRAIAPEIFKTRKITGIFKYILANPGQTVTREKLAAAFWPDSDRKAASNSLRVALFELRKAMAALDMAFESGAALIAEDRSGFYVCRPEIVESDVSKFAFLYDKLRAGNLHKDEEIAVLREMTGLYDGDFIEDSDAEDCAVTRAHYKAVFVEVSYKLAEHYRGEGKTELAEEHMLKHLIVDPFDERICGMLIDMYRQSGRGGQADSLRKQFSKYFEKEMGVMPEV